MGIAEISLGGAGVAKKLTKNLGESAMQYGQRRHKELTKAYWNEHGDLPKVRYNRQSTNGSGRPDINDIGNKAVGDWKKQTTDKILRREYDRQLFRYAEENDADWGIIIFYD
ncbi:MAG: hypothetical protein JNM34_06200 [Chthonomonadaceae bacterium]|nr:hypothetical protein [Chthonomonadaceae bacterium]